MAIQTKQPSIIPANTQSPGAVRKYVGQLQQARDKNLTTVSEALSSVQTQLDTYGKFLRSPLPNPEEITILDQNGALIAWVGNREFGGKQYFGAGFQSLYVGGDINDPANANLIASASGLSITNASITLKNGSRVINLDPSQPVISVTDPRAGTSFLGYDTDTPVAITSISNTTPPVVLTGSAHNYMTGDTTEIAGNSVSAYNADFIVTVVEATHFSIPIAPAGAGTGGTSTRYFAGILGSQASFAPTTPGNPWTGKIRIQADGSVSITGATFSLSKNGVTTKINNDSGGTFGVQGLSVWDDPPTFAQTVIGLGQIVLSSDGTTENVSILNTGKIVLLNPTHIGVITLDPGPGTLTINNGFPVIAMTGIGSIRNNGVQVVSTRQPAVPTVSGTAGATYRSVEQGLLNSLIATVQAIYTTLGTAG